MKKVLLTLIFSIFITSLYAGPADKIKSSGFIDKNVRLVKGFEINDPKNKIIVIYNHGQNKNDMALQSCAWVSMLRNSASLIDEEIDGKRIMVYNFLYQSLSW